MSLCLLRTASLIHERIAYTTLSPVRLIHQYRKRQFESFSSLWSPPVSSTDDHTTAAPAKTAPVLHTLHHLLHNSPMVSKCSCHSLVFGMCNTSDQTLKKNVPSVLICNMSTDVPDDKKLSYEELLDLIKKKEVTLIDVRSRVEVKSTGLLPKSFHIPVNEYVTAMKVPDKIFKKKYGFDKPRPEDPIVFVCSTGARSYKALRAALHMGYNKARMFDGSFSDLAKQITDT